MVEIILVVYITCFTLSACLIAWQYSLVSRQLQSQSLQNLNTNLAKVGLFWSNEKSDFASLQEGSIEADQRKAKLTVLAVGLLGFASVPGFLLLLAVILSMRYLARSRKERAVFASRLIEDAILDATQVNGLVEEFKNIL